VARAVFLRQDLRWIWFSLKFDAVALAVLAVVFALVDWSLDFGDVWLVGLAVLVGPEVARFVEPFLWRFFTLRRTTYYVTNQRVVSVPGRRARATPLADIDVLEFVVEPNGSGHIRIDRRISPDGIGHRTVSELFHVPDVREVVDLLSGLTGQTAVTR
jgi:hypothetical protein